MADGWMGWLPAAPAVWLLAALLAFALFGTAAALLPPRRWPRVRRRFAAAPGRGRSLLCRMLGVPRREHPAMRRRQALLAACGLHLDAVAYTCWKRLAVLTAAAGGPAAWLLARESATGRGPHALWPLAVAGLLALLLFDGPLLERLQQVRRYRIMQELDAIGRHLLYTGGLRINLHARLLRCVPLVRVLRTEWYRLTADWYQGAEEALRRFRERVGTPEARDFAETLNALRQYEDDRYYDLLRERIADNKAKMELLRESRTEMIGYVFLVLAGVPVMYAFRLFLYPWVAEGQRLFQLLD